MMIERVVITNQVTGVSITFDKVKTENYLLDTCIVSPIDADIATQQAIGMDGSIISNIRYEARTLSIAGWIIGKDDAMISSYRKALNGLINPKQMLEIIFNNYRLCGYPTQSVVYGNTVQELNEKMSKFLTTILCPNPVIETESPHNVQIAAWRAGFRFPLKFDLPGNKMIFGVRTESRIVSIPSDADVNCGMVITLRAIGNLSIPRVTNISAQEHLELNLTMHAGDRVIIDTRMPYTTAYLYNALDERSNAINSITDDSTYLQVPPGESQFTYSAEENEENLQVSFEYRPGYLEVL